MEQQVNRIRVLIGREIHVMKVVDTGGISNDEEAQYLVNSMNRAGTTNQRKEIMRQALFNLEYVEECARKGMYKILRNEKDKRAG